MNVPKKAKRIFFSVDSKEAIVDEYLENNFDLGINWFHSIFDLVNVDCRLRRNKRKLDKLRARIEFLKSLKAMMPKELDRILLKGEFFRDIEWKLKKYKLSSEKAERLAQEQRNERISTLFNLKRVFLLIDEEIENSEKQILYIKAIDQKTMGGKNPIQPITLVVLVWLFAMKKAKRRSPRYKVVELLLEWFFNNYEEKLKGYFQFLPPVSQGAIRRAYERYLKSPNQKQKIYIKLIRDFYYDSFESDDSFDLNTLPSKYHR